ncbi:MAG TPA: alpha/beta hydrolase [Candidatus Limnocylindria bacterium]|nr:alpha/beta hydrolase [Candidatus Limnocylindria bacterium]
MSIAPPATPLFFTSAGRPLYAVFHAPERERRNAPVLVHCHTLGVEQLTSYRPEVLNARAAAAAGFPVFRFHARGHGDSSGDFAAVTLATLADDAMAAADQARELSGARRVIWLGVRFGALMAAATIGRRDDAAGLALWEPVHRPADYFRSMLRGVLFSKVAQGQRPDQTVDELLQAVEREGQVDVHGYYLHRALVQSSRQAELGERLGGWLGPTLIAQVQMRPRLADAHAALATSLAERGAPVRTVLVHEEPGWQLISNPPWLGQDLVRHTVEWLDAVA